MPGVIPLEDAQDMYTSRLQDHVNGLLQQAQDFNQPPLQNVSPEAIPADAAQAAQRAATALTAHAQSLFAPPSPEPEAVDDATQSLQQHAQSLFDQAQAMNAPPLQGVDPIQAALGAAEQAGANMSQFAQTLSQHLQTAGGDATSAALGAAESAGADMSKFTSALNDALPKPSTTPSTATPSGAAAPTPGGDLRDYARQAAQKAGIDADIFVKQITQESGFDPSAKSQAGAIGIAQFMPSTARGLGIDPTDPYAALTAAANLDAQNLKRYNGDYAKALAAYNAGPGAVDDAGGVPDFAETKRYVSNILGGAASAVGSAASAVGTAADTARGTVANAVLPTLSQFGDRELNSAEAYAACGPAAAVRFAQMFGRNPTLREAVDLAKNVGWTADSGMAGLQSESKLFDEMQIPHRVLGADWQAFAKEAQSGNPVTLSTPGHYFTADSYDPSTGAFHVGSSGTDLRGGKEWMTPAEMEQRMGPLQGGLAADNPNIPGTSPLSQGTRPAPAPTNIVEQGAQAVAGGLKQVDQAITDVVQGAVNAPGTLARGTQDVANQLATEAPQHLQNIQNQLRGTPAEAIGGMLRGPELLSDDEVLRSPQADTARQMLEQFRQASVAKGINAPPVTDQDVAGAARTMLEGQAFAMTGKGIGREPLPAEPARLGGAAAGGVAGYQSAPADATDEDRLTRTLGGAAIGAGGVNAAALGVAGARALGGPVSRFGSTIASALGPTESLPAAARTPIQQFANMVGRQSDAASVMAHSSHLLAGGLDDAGDSIRQMLRSDASKQLVRDLQAQGLAVPVGDAPRNFRMVTDVPGNPLSNYAFDPSVVGPIKAVIDRSSIPGNQLGSAVLNAVGTAKSTLFSLSNFHTMTEGLNAAFSSPQTLKNYSRAFLSDSFTQAARGTMSDTFDAAAQAGVTGLSGAGRASADAPGQLGNAVWRRAVSGTVGGVGGAASGYTEAKIGGKSDEEAWQQALMGGAAGAALGAIPLGSRGTVPEILQSSLWERAVPMAKVTAWDGLTKGGLAPDVAAQVVNERFGGLNYAAMGRNPTLMDATRLLVQAPDWTESTVRQLGSAMFGGSGQGVRAGFLAKAIAGTLAATEVANYALSGHSTLENQPGHQFEIEMRDPSGGFMHIGLMPGNVQSFLNEGNKLTSDDSAKRAADLTNFVTGRLSEPARLASEAAQTASAGGSSLRTPYAVGKAGPVAGLLSTLAPVGISQVAQGVDEGGVDPKLAVAMAAAGLNPRYTSAAAAQRSGFTAPGQPSRVVPKPAPKSVAPAQKPLPAPARKS